MARRAAQPRISSPSTIRHCWTPWLGPSVNHRVLLREFPYSEIARAPLLRLHFPLIYETTILSSWPPRARDRRPHFPGVQRGSGQSPAAARRARARRRRATCRFIGMDRHSRWFGERRDSSTITGYLLKRDYQEGALVKKGDVLFEIDPRPFEAALAEAKSQLGSSGDATRVASGGPTQPGTLRQEGDLRKGAPTRYSSTNRTLPKSKRSRQMSSR